MSFWRNLLGSRSAPAAYVPWSSPYFQRRLEHERSLKEAPTLFRFNGYEVVEQHAGGMGEVLIARTPDRKGLAALKRVKAEDTAVSAEARQQFADEATILFGLSYSYHLLPEDIVRDPLRETCTLILPFCAGGSLADRASF